MEHGDSKIISILKDHIFLYDTSYFKHQFWNVLIELSSDQNKTILSYTTSKMDSKMNYM